MISPIIVAFLVTLGCAVLVIIILDDIRSERKKQDKDEPQCRGEQ